MQLSNIHFGLFQLNNISIIFNFDKFLPIRAIFLKTNSNVDDAIRLQHKPVLPGCQKTCASTTVGTKSMPLFPVFLSR